MKIKFIGRRPREIAGPRALVVHPGEVVEVGDELGRSLLEQPRLFASVRAGKPATTDSAGEAAEEKEK